MCRECVSTLEGSVGTGVDSDSWGLRNAKTPLDHRRMNWRHVAMRRVWQAFIEVRQRRKVLLALRRLFLLEDEADIRALVVEWLQECGYVRPVHMTEWRLRWLNGHRCSGSEVVSHQTGSNPSLTRFAVYLNFSR